VALDIRLADLPELTVACGVWFRAEAARTGVSPGAEEKRAFIDEMTVAFGKPGARLLVGTDDGEIIATIYGVPLHDDPSAAQVAMLAVTPERWGGRVGARMLAQLMTRLRHAGCVNLRMNVDPDNVRARALYERQGWTHTGETEQSDANARPELIYRTSPQP
jgi:ribosomal protein S18 acetylase RimI-like enzyme